MKRAALLITTLALGCGPGTDTADTANDGTGSGSATSSTGSGSGSASDTSGQDGTTSADDGSAGPEPIDLCDTTIAMGISGLAIRIECDVGPPEECEFPGSGRMIAVFTEDPRVTVDEFFPSELDPAILPVAQTTADADGRFEIELSPGTWVLCAVSGDSGYCQTDIIVDDAQPIRTATHYSGNGDSWGIGTCPIE